MDIVAFERRVCCARISMPSRIGGIVCNFSTTNNTPRHFPDRIKFKMPGRRARSKLRSLLKVSEQTEIRCATPLALKIDAVRLARRSFHLKIDDIHKFLRSMRKNTAFLLKVRKLLLFTRKEKFPKKSCVPGRVYLYSSTFMLKFNSIDAVILGCVQGVTEFLPVSSTGHLILANHFLKLNGHEEQVTDPKAYAETKKALDDYLAIIQLGTVIILFIFYWSKIVLLLKGLFNRSQEGLLLLRNLIIAFLPAAASGFLLDGLIQRYIYRNWSVLLALFAGGLLMLWVERRRKAIPR